MDRRTFLVVGAVGMLQFSACSNSATIAGPAQPPLPHPGAGQTITLTDSYPVVGGRYLVEVEIEYQSTTVSKLQIKIVRHPYQTSVAELLLQTQLLEQTVDDKIQLFLGNQPLFQKLFLIPKGQPIRLRGDFVYLINGLWVARDVATQMVGPDDQVSITLGDNRPAVIL